MPSPTTTYPRPALALARGVVSPLRFTIYFEDDALRERAEATARQLLRDAMDASNGDSNTTRLAKKALKYRNVLHRIEGVDVASPAFSASAFLGVEWCKTADLKAFCAQRQWRCVPTRRSSTS